jgi:hypothetical protein
LQNAGRLFVLVVDGGLNPMWATLQKATRDIVSKAWLNAMPSERRSYGQDIRLWNDRDPRVDQSFFQGSVPGFVIANDQTIVDWNIGFDLVFGSNPSVKRGMPLAEWYELIENYKRLPNREEKLNGEAMLAITDRERVVFVSPDFGRMVFMRIMSPVLDRVTGRVIGWNITLNVNSVHERVKFFTELNDRIQNAVKHSRYVMGFDQLSSKSRIMHDAVQKAISDLDVIKDVLLLGAVGAAPFIEEILTVHPDSRVSVMDDDTEALRHLRHKLSRYGKRIKVIRRDIIDLSIVPEDRFDAAIILWPKVSSEDLQKITRGLNNKLADYGRISVISWSIENGASKFWEAVRRDLEGRREIDLVRWHMGVISSELVTHPVCALDAGALVGPGLAQIVEIAGQRLP